jgi:hypothetical protein
MGYAKFFSRSHNAVIRVTMKLAMCLKTHEAKWAVSKSRDPDCNFARLKKSTRHKHATGLKVEGVRQYLGTL